MNNNIYVDLRNLLIEGLFGGNSTTLTTNQDLIVELVSMIGTLFIIAVPFMLVYWVIRFITNR